MGLVPSLYKPRTRIYNGQRTHHNDMEENAPPLVLWGVLALSGLLSSGWV